MIGLFFSVKALYVQYVLPKGFDLSHSFYSASESGCWDCRCHFLEGYCIKINSFPRVPISTPESGISAPLVIYSGCPGHGHPGEVVGGLHFPHCHVKWGGYGVE